MALLFHAKNYPVPESFHDRLFERVKIFRPTAIDPTPQFVEIMRRIAASTHVFDRPEIARPPMLLCASMNSASAHFVFEGIPVLILDETQIAGLMAIEDAYKRPLFIPWLKEMVNLAGMLAAEGDLHAAADVADFAHTKLAERGLDGLKPAGYRNVNLEASFDVAHSFVMGHELGHHLIAKNKKSTEALVQHMSAIIDTSRADPVDHGGMHFRAWPGNGLQTLAPKGDNALAKEMTCDIFGIVASLLQYQYREMHHRSEGEDTRETVFCILSIFTNLYLEEMKRRLAQSLAHWKMRGFIEFSGYSFLQRAKNFFSSADVLNRMDLDFPWLELNKRLGAEKLTRAVQTFQEISDTIGFRPKLLSSLIKGIIIEAIVETVDPRDREDFFGLHDDRVLETPDGPDKIKKVLRPIEIAVARACYDSIRVLTSGRRRMGPYHRAASRLGWKEMAVLVYRPLSDYERGKISYPFIE